MTRAGAEWDWFGAVRFLVMTGTVLNALILVVAPGRAQSLQTLLDRPAHLEVESVTLEEAIRALQRSSGVTLAYSIDLLPTDRRVTCHCQDVTVRSALDTLLFETDLEYRETRRQVLIGRPTREAGSSAPPVGTLTGVVLAEGQEWPLAGVQIQLLPSGRFTLTGQDGRFLFRDVDTASEAIRATALGFEEITIPFTLDPIEGMELRVELRRTPVPLAGILIAPGSFGVLDVSPAVTGTAVSRDDIEAIPSFGDDVFRTLKRMPGVASGDISAKLHVRGSTERNLLVRLDGLELFEPYHLKDFDGTFGIVDVQSLGRIDLITGGFPVEFGDKWGAVFDMRTRRPPSTGTRTTVGVSLNSLSLINQGKFSGGRGQWLVSLRRGFLEYVLKMVGVQEDISPSFWDVLGKVQYLLSDDHLFSIEMLHAGDDVKWNGHRSGERIISDWANSYGWVNWKASFTPWLWVETLLFSGRLTRDRIGSGGDPSDGVFSPLRVDVSDIATSRFGGIKQDWQLELTGDVLVKTGVDLRFNSGAYDYSATVDRLDLDENGHVVTVTDSTAVRKDVSGTEFGTYLSMRARAPGNLTWEAGVRFDRKSHTGDADLSPRLLLRWDPLAHTSVKGSWGHYRQAQGIHELNVIDGDSLFRGSERAEQVALGIERQFGRGWHGRVEAYSRVVDDPRPVYVNLSRNISPILEVESDRTRLDPKRGRAKGLEFHLSNETTGPWSWSGSYALAWAEHEVEGTWIPATLDQLHTVNLHAAYRWGKEWQFSGSWQYRTGWPITESFLEVVVTELGDTGEQAQIIRRGFGPPNAGRLPPYHRLDLRVTRNIEVGRSRLEIFLDVFNAYNRENIRSYRYSLLDPDGDGLYTTRRGPGEELLPIMPTLGLRWVF